MDLISHPFRLEANGGIATVVDGTDDAYAEGIAVLVLTRKGERPLVPDFGMTEPTFDDVDLAELNVALDDFGPPVEVADAAIDHPDDRTEAVVLTFAPIELDDQE